MSNPEYFTVKYGSINVCWFPDLDGGGRDVGQTLVYLVQELFGKVDRIFEIGCGPGFIGFSLLANGLCDSLALSDINADAVAAVNETIRRNGLTDRVSVYHSDGFKHIPPEEQFDVLVANPPSSTTPISIYVARDNDNELPKIVAINPETAPTGDVRLVPGILNEDLDLEFHKEIYQETGKHLRAGGSVLMLENTILHDPKDFPEMISKGDLAHVRNLWCGVKGWPSVYCVWSKKMARDLLYEDEIGSGPIRVVISKPAPTCVTAPANVINQFQLVSHLKSNVRVELFDVSREQCVDTLPPLGEVEAGGRLDLPALSLPTGTYAIQETETSAALAKIEVRETG